MMVLPVRLTTVAAAVSATDDQSAVPSSTCCASLKTYTPGRISVTVESVSSAVGVDPPLRTSAEKPGDTQCIGGGRECACFVIGCGGLAMWFVAVAGEGENARHRQPGPRGPRGNCNGIGRV